MLKESKYHLDNLPGDLYDLDIAPSGRWIGVTGFGDRQSISFGGTVIPLPEPLRFPHVAAIDGETALVVNSRTRQDKKAWIINSSGSIRANFFAGDAVQAVLASKSHLVVTYFDESACTSRGIEGNGVAVFDSDGRYRFGYRELFGAEAVEISDCYCACWAEENNIFFFPYRHFPLVSFDLASKSQKIWVTPEEVAGSRGITVVGQTVYFHAPFNDETGIYRWPIGDKYANKIGSHVGRLRGLRGGRFLSVEKAGYTIIFPAGT